MMQHVLQGFLLASGALLAVALAALLAKLAELAWFGVVLMKTMGAG